MKKRTQLSLTLAVTASILAGSAPAWAGDVSNVEKVFETDRSGVDFYGAHSTDGGVFDNKLTLTGKSTITLESDFWKDINPNLSAAYGEMGDANGNRLTVTGEASIQEGGKKTDDTFVSAGRSETGNANNNQVLFNGSGKSEFDYLYGGKAEKGDANENYISIESGELRVRKIISGDGRNNANKNHIAISGGTVDVGSIYVGDALHAAENTLSVSDGFIDAGTISAGRGFDKAVKNQVSITGGTLEVDRIVGARGDEVVENQVLINSRIPLTKLYRIIGGEGDEIAQGNLVSITDSEINTTQTDRYSEDYILGGNGEDGFAVSNCVLIQGNSKVTSTGIAGGYSEGVRAAGNLVSIGDGSLVTASGIAGGWVINWYPSDEDRLAAEENKVELNDRAQISTLGITGGVATVEQGIAQNNTVSLGQSVTVTAPLVGGGTGPSVMNNLVDIQGSLTGYLVGGGGAVNLADLRETENLTASGNAVNLVDAKLKPITKEDTLFQNDKLVNENKGKFEKGIACIKEVGDSLHIAGGALLAGGKAQDNAVNLSGSTDLSQAKLYGWIIGPDLLKPPFDKLVGADLKEVDHSGNALNVGYAAAWNEDGEGRPILTGKAADWKGSQVQGIYNFDKVAFYTMDPDRPVLTVTSGMDLPDTVTLDLDHFAPSAAGTVIRDEVLIDASQAEASQVNGLTALYGDGTKKYQGKALTRQYAHGGVTVTGTSQLALSQDNILSYGFKDLDRIDYHTLDWKTNGTVLILGDSQKFDLADTKVHTEDIGFTAKSLETITKAGDYVMTLLDTQGNKTLSAGNLTTKKGTWNVGNALEGTGEASLDKDGNVVYQLDTVEKPQKPEQPEIKVDASKQTHNALIANEAALGTLAAGRDRMEGVLDTFNGQEGGVFTFASIGGSKDKYDTGSQSSTYTWNGLAGVGNDVTTRNGEFSYGAFYEYGKGHYDVDGAGYTGSGDAHYSGGGLMAKYVARNKNYGEASLHFGQLKNNADSVLHSRSGSAYGYETDSNYWSGHVGFGHIFDLTDQVASTSRGGTERASRDLDVYGKYFYTHVGGDNFRAGDADYQLDDLNSSLLRIGARLNNRSGRNNYYCGLAWDYEFDGESKGTVSAAGLQADIRKADIGGSSMMAEAGWKLEATKDSPWDVNLSVRAYAGQHKGIGGNVVVGYHF